MHNMTGDGSIIKMNLQQNIDMSVVMQTIAQLTQQLADKDRLISERDNTITQLQRQQGSQYAGDTILFTDFAESWFAGRKHTVGQGTYAKNRINYDKHIMPHLKGMMLSEVTVPVVQGLLNLAMEHLSSATVKLVKSTLKMILDSADGQDLIKKNPMPFVRIKYEESRHKRALTADERKRLFLATEKERLWIVPYLALGTGMRQEEVLGLKWSCVDFERKQIYIEEVYARDCHSKAFKAEPKTKKSRRYIAVDDVLLEKLREYQKEQKEAYGYRTYVVNNRREDKQTHPKTIDKKIRLWRTLAGIDDLSFHMFRHTYATLAFDSGVPMLTLCRQMGHADTRLLETTYIHQMSTKDQHECAELIGTVMY